MAHHRSRGITSKRRAKDIILGPKSKEDRKLAKARLRAAKVPKPQLSSLTSLPNKETFLEYCRVKAHTWVTNADTFLLSVDINDLKARPKNTEDLKSSAAQRIRSMEIQPEDARSAICKDKNGITLACVLAWRVPECAKLTDTDYSGAQGRTLNDVIGSNPSQNDYDGLDESLIKRALEAARTLHSVLHPITPDRDIRHNEEEKYMVYSPDGGSLEISERAGVTHLVQCWTMQGHKNGPFMPSSDFFRGCQAALAVNYYYKLTERVAIYLQCAFAEAFPTYYAKYTSAFKAGVWETADPGPWLGRAIVYKLQVGEHVDGLDDGPTACFCVGNFDGGPMYLLEVRACYRAGDILIFMSGLCVGKWTPKGGITPVFFSPQNSIAQLEGKADGWMKRTMGGASMDSDATEKVT
ncbi:hypothetical protein B0H14DRAFT_2765427 [Mycena olivaceomarginata]|nr:hypothetical protein B0H14DRAFT_2765427 [Mycena olivaceomarginata]